MDDEPNDAEVTLAAVGLVCLLAGIWAALGWPFVLMGVGVLCFGVAAHRYQERMRWRR